MTTDLLLSRLERVRRTAPGRWIACCPAHDDRSPSLAIRELDDGRALLHCFAGCGAKAVLAALGLDFDALHPERRLGERVPAERRPYNAADILACVAQETLIVAVSASQLAAGTPLSDAARERLWLATSRLNAASELASGRH